MQPLTPKQADRLFDEYIRALDNHAALLKNLHRRWLDAVDMDDATLLKRIHEVRRVRGKLTSVMATLSDTLAAREGASWLQRRRVFGIPLPVGEWDLSDPHPMPPEFPGM